MEEFKRIADSVYGTIGFTKPEIDIINTRIFQRLRVIKHLGLASLVYPSADFSRFSHSLGVCHITGRIIETLLKNKEIESNKNLSQIYRMAGLLHDIGHYPFSHIFEIAIKDFYRRRSSEAVIDNGALQEGNNTYLSHEDLTREIVLNSSEIRNIFIKYDIDTQDVINVLTSDSNCAITNLLGSDFDADRIDYLLRTANSTSLPYGSIDCDYLISQIKFDKKTKKIVLDKKALKTADHFLLSRYFAYQQLSYHKAVVGLELLFKDIIIHLINSRNIECSSDIIAKKIQDERWINFDDSFILNLIHSYNLEEAKENLKTKIESLINRFPPALVFEEEFIAKIERRREIMYLQKIITDKKAEWAEKYKIDKDLWKIWDNEGKKITEIESHIPVVLSEDEEQGEKEKRTIKSLDILEKQCSKSKPIVSITSSLMHVLSNYNLFCLRLYVIIPRNKWNEKKEISEKISKEIKEEIAKIRDAK